MIPVARYKGMNIFTGKLTCEVPVVQK